MGLLSLEETGEKCSSVQIRKIALQGENNPFLTFLVNGLSHFREK